MRRIPLTRGMTAIVDDEDYKRIRKWKWQATKKHNGYYATRAFYRRDLMKNVRIGIHQLVLNPSIDYKGEIDHINGNGLDNRKINLRLCSHSQNMKNMTLSKANTSGYKGVTWYKPTNKWLVQINISEKVSHVGYYFSLIKAAQAYDDAARKHYGAFASLNFPGDGERGCNDPKTTNNQNGVTL